MNELTIFSNSSGYLVKDINPGTYVGSYMHQLMEDYNVTGYWRPGLCSLDYRKMVGEMAKRFVPMIIQIGCVDAVTRPPEVYISLCLDYILTHGYDEYIAPSIREMKEASLELSAEKRTYRRLVPINRFRELLSDSCRFFPPGQAIFMGVVKPFGGNDRVTSQLYEYNLLVEQIAKDNNQHFVDIWNLTEGRSTDNTHLDHSGHCLVFTELRRLLDESG